MDSFGLGFGTSGSARLMAPYNTEDNKKSQQLRKLKTVEVSGLRCFHLFEVVFVVYAHYKEPPAEHNNVVQHIRLICMRYEIKKIL